MPVLQIVIDTRRLPPIAMTEGLAAVLVAIVTAIQEIIMTEEIMTQVVTTIREMVIQHRVTAVPVEVEGWKKTPMEQEV